MKKLPTLLLAALLLVPMTACGEDYDDYEDPYFTDTPADGAYTLDDLAGWWTKPADFDGITVVPTFCIDPAGGTATVYDDYGNPLDTLVCWYDDAGFSIEIDDEIFGTATYFYDGDALCDDTGEVQYVRRDPIDPAAAPVSAEELLGTWYKNGNEDYTILYEDGRYRMETLEIPMESGTYRVTEHITSYDHTEYRGPAVEMEPDDGFSSSLYVAEDGNILYDDFHREFYIRDVSDAALIEKYTISRDSWSSDGDTYNDLEFKFFGELWLSSSTDGFDTERQTIGTWAVENGVLYLNYSDGNVEKIDLSGGIPDEITSDLLGITFIRWKAW